MRLVLAALALAVLCAGSLSPSTSGAEDAPAVLAVEAPSVTDPGGPDGWAPAAQARGAPRLRGSVDVAAGTAVVQGTALRVAGWVVNLDDPSPPGVAEVQIFAGDPAGGRLLGTAAVDRRRPDVARVLADPRLEASGFEVLVPTGGLVPGPTTLTVAAGTREHGWWQRSVPLTVVAASPRPAGQFVYGAWLTDPMATARLAKAAGLTHMSAYVSWSKVEPSRGRYLFKERTSWGAPVANDLTNVLTAAREAGLQVVLRLDDPPAWAGGEVYRLDPADVERYVYEAVTYGRGTVAYVVAFNELNLPDEWGTTPVDPGAYVKLLAAARRGARRADPTVRIVAPAVAPRTGGGFGTMEDVEWLEAVYRAGGQEHFDVMGMNAYLGGFHPETDPSCVPMCFRTVELQRAVMERYGDGAKPVLITELGALEQTPHDLGPYEWMELPADRRAEHLVAALRLANAAYPWIAGAMVFNLDYAAVPWVAPNSAMHWFSLLNPDRSPRQAYLRLRDARAAGLLS
ncbi:MAG TPA: hypothetical protein VHS99_19240 [Chloroflexota bacterium]|nr:hypothetical protein [Chloroflexota bacterium]